MILTKMKLKMNLLFQCQSLLDVNPTFHVDFVRQINEVVHAVTKVTLTLLNLHKFLGLFFYY